MFLNLYWSVVIFYSLLFVHLLVSPSPMYLWVLFDSQRKDKSFGKDH
jgi:hypothetical protein